MAGQLGRAAGQGAAGRRRNEALAKQAERAGARDGFSVDDALREAGCDTFRAFVLKSLNKGAGQA
jgi:hypothetical protein